MPRTALWFSPVAGVVGAGLIVGTVCGGSDAAGRVTADPAMGAAFDLLIADGGCVPTIFYAAEFRWNLSEETTPFDYFIWKDVRTGMQVAFFAETGSVADTTGELGDKFASSYGAGFRLVSASGNVYRADLATGDEGAETTLIFFYPW